MYQLKLKRHVPGRFLKNVGGKLVVFHDGIAGNVSEETLAIARRKHTVFIVEEIPAEVEEVAHTAESIQALYEEHGTWAKVAEALGLSVSKLSALRKSLEN